jgi:hypothetical protein
MDAKVICVVLSFAILATAGPVVDDTKGHMDNSVKTIFVYYLPKKTKRTGDFNQCLSTPSTPGFVNEFFNQCLVGPD